MNDYQSLFNQLKETALHPMADSIPHLVAQNLDSSRWGDLPDWLECLDLLPKIRAESVEIEDGVRIGTKDQLTISSEELFKLLMKLHPWRKGPFNLFDVKIDSEWRSDFKWNRVKPHLQSLTGRLVLDIGCGNGYHCWRMLGAGAKRVIGIDPSVKFVCQFYAIKKFAGAELPVDVLPLSTQQMPDKLQAFDTVFSMGVLYHRKSPIDHLIQLRDLLRPGGQLILETLVVEGPDGFTFMPEARYAQMRNVWFLPSPATLGSWLRKIGFINVKLVDLSVTSSKEQRTTRWMTYHSLQDFLETNGSGRTIEGHPPPTRAILTAELSL
jgi:tRNA (mo5U34)-methyltransferase